SREGSRCRLRRLRHQASRVAAFARKNCGSKISIDICTWCKQALPTAFGGQNAVTNRRSNRRASAAFLRSAIASAEYLPCFQFAFRLRANPSGVRGPVLFADLIVRPLARADKVIEQACSVCCTCS